MRHSLLSKPRCVDRVSSRHFGKGSRNLFLEKMGGEGANLFHHCNFKSRGGAGGGGGGGIFPPLDHL